MNDSDILRHDRLDRVITFGIENLSDLPAGCEAIARFANVATFSCKLNGFKVGQLRGPASLQALLDALWLDFKDMMQNLYRRNPAKLHAWLAASRVERSPKRKQDDGNAAADGTTPPAPQP